MKVTKQVSIRRATLADVENIVRVHYAAVHETAAGSYAPDILDEWSPPVTPARIEEFNKTFIENEDDELMFVAVENNEIIAFGSIVAEACELRAVYVSPKAGRTGVGAQLLYHLEGIARSLSVPRLCLDASLNAEQFYLRQGYISERIGDHFLRSGRRMDCVYMSKEL